MIFTLLGVIIQVFAIKCDTFSDEFDALELTEFASYIGNFFAFKNSVHSEREWKASLPTEDEKEEMRKLVSYLYNLSDFSNINERILDEYPILEPLIQVTRIKDYIVIHEKIPINGYPTKRNFGLFALLERSKVKRNLHHSSVHFDSEGPVHEQAAYLCQHTNSRSLVLHGASRFAIKGNPKSSCQTNFTISDGAHNADTMFQLWSSVLFDLSEKENPGQAKFIQWHGMTETRNCSIFISFGSGNPKIYTSECPATRLTDSVIRLSKKLNATTPATNQLCNLFGGSNVLGRYINGVSRTELCKTEAEDENIKGQFIHIEQKAMARSSLRLWKRAICDTFPVRDNRV